MTILECNRLKNVDDVNSNEIFVDVESLEEKEPEHAVGAGVLEQDCRIVPNENSAQSTDVSRNSSIEANAQTETLLEQLPANELVDVRLSVEDPATESVVEQLTTDVPVPEQVPAETPVTPEVTAESPVPAQIPEHERLIQEILASAYPKVEIERLSEETIDKRTRLRLKRYRWEHVSDNDDEDDNWTPEPQHSTSLYNRSAHFSKKNHELVLQLIDQTLAKFHNFTAAERKKRVTSYYSSLKYEQKLRWLPKARCSFINWKKL